MIDKVFEAQKETLAAHTVRIVSLEEELARPKRGNHASLAHHGIKAANQKAKKLIEALYLYVQEVIVCE